MPGVLRWLVSMQVPYVPDSNADEDQDISNIPDTSNTLNTSNIQSANASLAADVPGLSTLSPQVPGTEGYIDGRLTGGFCGRINKRGDTCYSFWVGGALDVLGHAELMDMRANRRFLLGQTQHLIGGFGKLPGVEWRPGMLHPLENRSIWLTWNRYITFLPRFSSTEYNRRAGLEKARLGTMYKC